MLRVEEDAEHRIFVKQCVECGNEFKMFVPKDWFEGSEPHLKRHLMSGIEPSEVRKLIDETHCPEHREGEEESV